MNYKHGDCEKLAQMKHGGVRTPGPGRTLGRPAMAATDKKVSKNISLRPDHAEWLRGKNVSAEIEAAMNVHINRGVVS